MDNVPPLQAEGPEFVQRVKKATTLTQKLEANAWEFAAAPQFFAQVASCDVAAKEIVNIYDGRVQKRFGRLVMKGIGSRFNLMSHESPNAIYLGAQPQIFSSVNRQLKSKGLDDFREFREMKPLQRTELYNPTVFYQLRDVVFWNALYEVGLFPTGFEDVAKQFTAGNVIRNLIFDSKSKPNTSPSKRSKSSQADFIEAFAAIEFPTPVLEWMPKPLFGGMSTDTIHIETLLTPKKSSLSHPFLPLVGNGVLTLEGKKYYFRRFAGIAPKDATRGPGVPAEGIKK